MDIDQARDKAAATANPPAATCKDVQTIAKGKGGDKKKKRHRLNPQDARNASSISANVSPTVASHVARAPSANSTDEAQGGHNRRQKHKRAKYAYAASSAAGYKPGTASTLPAILSLPLETISSIFDMVADDVDSVSADMLPEARRCRRAQPFVIAAVCRLWREVALKTPNLWRNVELLPRPSSEKQPAEIERERLYFNRVRHCAGKSKATKFRVRLIGPLMCVTRIWFERIVDRVEYLYIHAGGNGDDLKIFNEAMASLETLQVHAESPAAWNRTVHLHSMPRLHTITSSGLILVPSSHLPSLRSIQLHGKRALETLASLLPYAPVVERVDIFLDKPGHKPLAPRTFVQCDTIKILVVHCDRTRNCGRGLRFLRRFFHFRGLEQLEVRWTGEPAQRKGKEDKETKESAYALPALAMLIQRAVHLRTLVLGGIDAADFKGSDPANPLQTFLGRLYDDALNLRQLSLIDMDLRTWVVTVLCKALTTRDALGWMWCQSLEELVVERPVFARNGEKRRKALMRLWDAVDNRAGMRRLEDEAMLQEVRYVKADGETVNVLEMMRRLS